ncbi:MAG: alkaline phosphatase family protein [Ilumatobacteraceae bacterium]
MSNIIPAILGPRGTAEIPQWMPPAVRGARQVVMLVLDGLGWHQLQQRASVCPTLASMSGGSITTVAPTTTVSALTSITTGLAPGEHGLVGYRIDMGGRVMQMLRWGDEKGDLRRTYPPDLIQPCPPFMGAVVPVLSKAELEGSAFTEAHLRGVRACGWRSASSIAVQVKDLLKFGHSFIYAYYDGVDKIAHERGFGEYYDAELRQADRVVADIASVLVPGSVLLVTADHGQVEVGTNTTAPHVDVSALTTYQSGEGRFRWLHSRPGAVNDLWAAASEHHGGVAWVMRRDELIDGGWFGSRVTDAARQRLGDVALIAYAPTSFDDSADAGAFPLICRHGALTNEELDVPLLALAVDN